MKYQLRLITHYICHSLGQECNGKTIRFIDDLSRSTIMHFVDLQRSFERPRISNSCQFHTPKKIAYTKFWQSVDTAVAGQDLNRKSDTSCLKQNKRLQKLNKTTVSHLTLVSLCQYYWTLLAPHRFCHQCPYRFLCSSSILAFVFFFIIKSYFFFMYYANH